MFRDTCYGAGHSVTGSAADMSLLEDWWKLRLLAACGCAKFLNSAGAGPDGVDVVGPGSALGQAETTDT